MNIVLHTCDVGTGDYTSTEKVSTGQGQDRCASRWIRDVTGTAGDIEMRIFDRTLRLETMLVQTGGEHHKCGRTLWIVKVVNSITG